MNETQYILNTFLLLFSGALVMLMAAGFSMLEAGMALDAMWLDKKTKTWE